MMHGCYISDMTANAITKTSWFGENPKGTVGTTVYRARGIAGRDGRGREVYVEIELVDFAVLRETDDHQIVAEYRDLRVRTNGSQDHWALANVVEPAPGLTAELLREFGNLAPTWHMNGRTDHCSHQHVRETERRNPADRWSTDYEADPCPVTGQAYVWTCPERWYVRELPADVEAAARAIGASLV